MAGPWEAYGAGPWSAYAEPSKPANAIPTMKDSIKEELATRSGLEKGLAGIGTFVDNAAMRMKQLLGKDLTPEEAANVRDNRTMNDESGAVSAGNIAGGLMATAVPGAALYRGATSLAGKVLPSLLSGTVAPSVGGATAGAATAVLTNPVLQGESEGANAGMGAIGGLLGDAAARVGARVAQPILQSQAVQNLLRHDVVPTPGQAAGPNSFLGKTEQKVQSLPLIGDVVTSGRNRASTEFNRAAINQAVPEGQAAITEIGNEGVKQMRAASSANYSGLLQGKTVQPDQALVTAIDQARNIPTLPLSESGDKRYDQIVKKLFLDRIPTSGDVPAENMKAEIIGDLGKAARDFLKSNDAEQKALGQALMGARDAAQSWMVKSAGIPARDIAVADTAYGAQKTVEEAAKSARARNGQFSSLELLRKSSPNSASERLAQSGQEVLPGVTPNSGTFDRAAMAMMLGGGAGAAGNEYFGGPAYVTGLLAAPLAYSRAGSRYAIGNLLPGQQAAASLLRQAAPYAATAGGLLSRKGKD